MLDGQGLTVWAVRGAACCYAVALVPSRFRLAFWTAGLALYLVHVWGAFEYFHSWSHAAAFQETARQTGEMFGVYWGGGLYLNYLFTIAWAGDCAWWWLRGEEYPGRAWVRGFMAFMFFNGVVVFGAGAVRWVGLAVMVALAALRLRDSKI